MNYVPSGCGVFGIMRKADAPKIGGQTAVTGIEAVKHRGSDLGAGFAVFNSINSRGYLVKAFAQSTGDITPELEMHGLKVIDMKVESTFENYHSFSFLIDPVPYSKLNDAVRIINERLWNNYRGRIYSSGDSMNIFKGVGFPADIADRYNVRTLNGDMWIAHTRQPTNSPGHYPYWSHPFSTFNTAIVHNGDLSSFGSNVEFLESRGVHALVGTDSEVTAYVFDELLREGLSIEEATQIMVNRSRRDSGNVIRMDNEFRGARLDGPFTTAIGYSTGNDMFLIAMVDRSKFRPAIIGEDQFNYYVASEEKQITEISQNARVWALEPGSYFMAGLKEGIISTGNRRISPYVFSVA